MARGPLAGAAGPGKFSKRTDLPSEFYGEAVETKAIKDSVPMAKTPDVKPQSRSEMGVAPSQLERLTPLFAPTQRKEDSLQGSMARPKVQFSVQQAKMSDTLVKLLPFDDTGEIAILYQEALSRGN